ncbi:hypothetical protein [Streptomyces sp. NPDC002573]|uniref:hypothetical protein n=1 Tax=Streptomyces sp. NPDC002573 TaxID=3364651 RepID=UPI0036D0C3E9
MGRRSQASRRRAGQRRGAALTVEGDEEWCEGRHWLIDPSGTRELVQITYPFPVTCPPTAVGDGTWFTLSASRDAVHVWTLETPPEDRPGD